MKAEFSRQGIRQSDVADFLGMTLSNFNKKVNESIPFTNKEMFSIRDEFFPSLTIDYLFQSDGSVPSKSERSHACIDAIADQIGGPDGLDEECTAIVGELHEAIDMVGD